MHYIRLWRNGDANTTRTEVGRFKKGHHPTNFSGNVTCTIDGCTRMHRGRGYCQTHYMRWFHHGDPLHRVNRLRGTAKERLSNMTDQDSNGCIVWRGAVDKRGYGRIVDDSGWHDMAHRLSYKLNVGDIPEGLVIHHKCYNTRCVNPDHLEPTTHNDNIINKGKTNAAYLNSVKTHCIRGHEFTDENTYMSKDNHRTCKLCHKRRVRDYLNRRRLKNDRRSMA